MSPPTDPLRLPEQNKFSATKLAVFLTGIISAGVLIVLAVPYLSTVIPRLCSSLRHFFAPPYLFITVNFIILTIWKLSENRALHSDQFSGEQTHLKSRDPASSSSSQVLRQPSRTDPVENLTGSAAAFDEHSPSFSVTALCSSTLVSFQGKVKKGMTAAELMLEEEDAVIDVSDSNRSGDLGPNSPSQLLSESLQPDTDASDENPSIVAAPESSCNAANSHGNVASAMTAMKSRAEAVEAVTDIAGFENDSMEATWNAIMKKAEIWGRSPPQGVKPWVTPAAVKQPGPAALRGGGALWEGDEDMNL